jgi:hypothetical protein
MKSLFGYIHGSILFAVVSGSVLGSFASPALSAENQPSAPCASPPYHQLDFWIGDWDVFETGKPVRVAHARIDSILNGCVLREDYQATDGHEGQSFTIYDNSKGGWHQTWVTSRGELLQIEGAFNNGEMILSGKNQQGAIVRGTWKPVDTDVREIAVISTDQGKTWTPWFDIVFRRRSDGVSAPPKPPEARP